MPTLSEDKEAPEVIAPMYSNLQKKVAQRAADGEYRVIWRALVGALVIVGLAIALSHLGK